MPTQAPGAGHGGAVGRMAERGGEAGAIEAVAVVRAGASVVAAREEVAEKGRDAAYAELSRGAFMDAQLLVAAELAEI